MSAQEVHPPEILAGPDSLELEALRRWISGSNPAVEELAIEELTGGGLPEIVSVGGTGTTGEIRVQGYSGSAFFDVASPVYPAEHAKGVATGNLDADPLNLIEIVSVGCGSTGGDLSLWRLSGGALGRVPGSQLSVPDACLEDVAVANLDADTFVEVIVTGYSWSLDLARLEVRSWDGTGWTTKAARTFDAGYDTAAYAVAVGDLDAQAPVEIVTVGHRQPTPSSPSEGLVTAWHYSTGSLTKIGEQSIAGGIQHGVTMWDVAIGDPDNDLLPEVLAVGSQDWLTDNAASQLRTYVLAAGGSFTEESQETRPGEYWLSVAMGDVDEDGQIEAVVAGQERLSSGGVWGALAVVRAEGTRFIHELGRHRWLSWTFPWSTVVGDPDGDLVTEFLTGSQRSPRDNAAEIRAWNWNVPPKPDDSWPQFHHDAAHRGWSAAVAPGTNTVSWSKEYVVDGDACHTQHSPIEYNGIVYVPVASTLRAYHRDDGTPAWAAPPTIEDNFLGPTVRSVAAGHGQVYYGGAGGSGTPHGVLSAYRWNDGARVWTKGAETFGNQIVWAPPTVVIDRVLVGTTGAPGAAPAGKVYAFDNEGNLLWTFSPGVDIMASVAASGTNVFVRAGTNLYSIPLDDPNGDGLIANPEEIDWTFSMGTWTGSRYDAALVGSPAVSEGFVYVGSHDGYLYKVPRVDPTPADATMTMADVTTGGGWRSVSLGARVASTPTAFSGAVYIGADLTYDPLRPFNAYLYRIDDADGAIVWSRGFHRTVLTSAPAVADGKVYIWARETGAQAFVYAFRVDGTALWSLLVHDTTYGTETGASVALSGGFLFATSGLWDCNPLYPANARPFIFAVKD